MAEAMFEVVLPDYFKKFQPNFKFFITEKIPNLSTFENYAFGSHFKSEYCPFSVENEKKNHYHILIQVDSEEQLNQFFPSQKRFSVPWIFTCFKYFLLLKILLLKFLLLKMSKETVSFLTSLN